VHVRKNRAERTEQRSGLSGGSLNGGHSMRHGWDEHAPPVQKQLQQKECNPGESENPGKSGRQSNRRTIRKIPSLVSQLPLKLTKTLGQVFRKLTIFKGELTY